MKKYIFGLLAAVASLTACNNNDIVPETDGNPMHQVIINVAAEQGLDTRANATGVDRYLIEVYTDAAYTTAANVFTGGTNKASSTTGSFSIVLDRTQEYHCLLWADKAGTDVYEATSLKAVTLKTSATPVEAWHGKLNIAAGANATLSTTLKRAVAKITLKETGKLPAGTLTLSFDQNTKFDVSTAAVAVGDTKAKRTETITVAETTGTKENPAKINTDDIFVLASVTDAEMPTLTFKMGDEESFEVPNVSLKANYNTNITGHYTKLNGTTFTVTCDDSQWETPNNETTFGSDYIELNGVKVAVGNLVVDGENGAKIGTATDNGLYFQFGSLIGWNGTDATSAPTIAISPAGYDRNTTWNKDWTGDSTETDPSTGKGDPCKYYLKGTWRLPTKTEYETLFNNNGYPSNGPWKWDKDSKFAIHSTSNLKFPAAGGLKEEDGGLLSVGGYGYYWSATLNSAEGYFMGLTPSSLSPGASDNPARGLSVRCVKD